MFFTLRVDKEIVIMPITILSIDSFIQFTKITIITRTIVFSV